MPRYKIGMSWGFAGDEEYRVIDADSEEEATKVAWEMACEQVEGYVIREIGEDEEVDEDGDKLESDEAEDEIEGSE